MLHWKSKAAQGAQAAQHHCAIWPGIKQPGARLRADGAADRAGSRLATACAPAQAVPCCSPPLSQQRPATSLLRHAWCALQGLGDQHAKVRWASCQALGQMCTDLGPKIQAAEHARILPALQRTMEDFREPRVQSHAAAALVNFAEDCEEVRPACHGARCTGVPQWWRPWIGNACRREGAQQG